MKKLTVLFAAVLCAAMSFADCNEYGWKNKAEMFLELQNDYNAYGHTVNAVKLENDSIFYMLGDGTYAYWKDVEASHASFNTDNGFCGQTWSANADMVTLMGTKKWEWLANYCKTVDTGLDATSQLAWRCNVNAFFFNSSAFTIPGVYAVVDYSTAGEYANFQAAWGTTFCQAAEDCNEYGWKNKAEMFLELQNDYNAYGHTVNAVKLENDSIFYMLGDGTYAYWEDVEASHASFNTDNGFCGQTWSANADMVTLMGTEKWAWLANYCKTVDTGLDATSQLAWRCNVNAFFFNSSAFTIPGVYAVVDYTTAGEYANFQEAWGQKFCTGAADGFKVTYVLPEGAVTNEFGWRNKNDIWKEWAWALHQACPNRAGSPWYESIDDVPHVDSIAKDYVANLIASGDWGPHIGQFTDTAQGGRWHSIAQYMIDVTASQVGTPVGSGTVPTLSIDPQVSSQTIWRFAAAAFWASEYTTSWPYSADFKVAGQEVAMMPAMKMGFCGDEKLGEDGSFIAGRPYLEGESFRGWAIREGDQAVVSTEDIVKMLKLQDVTLYARFGMYVSNLAEVWAQVPEAGSKDTVAIKTGGVVTYVNGGQFFIQDVYGGMLCYTKNHGLAVGDQVEFKAGLINYNGYGELCNITDIEKLQDGQIITPEVVTIGSIGMALESKGFCKVHFSGLKLYKAEDKKLYFCADGDSILYFNSNVKAADYTVNAKYDVDAIVSHNNGELQIVGDPAWIVKAATTVKDPATYAPLVVNDEVAGEITYTITSDWMYAAATNNWEANKPAPALEQCRGMVVKDGIIYFTWRSSNTPNDRLKLVRYDAATGDRMDDLILAEYIFRQPAADTTENPRWYTDKGTGLTYIKDDYEWNYDEFNYVSKDGAIYTFGPNTGMYMDEAGHILVADLPTSGTEYQVWMIDEKTGEGQLVIYCGGNSGASTLKERWPDDGDIRFDRFGVAGDVTKDATIFTVNMNSDKAYTFDIVDGKWDGEMWQNAVGGGAISSFGQAPQVNPVDGGASFYVSGSGLYPTLVSAEDGTILESFNGVFDEEENPIRESCVTLLYDTAANAAAKVAGCCEFKVGGAYFFSMSAATWEGAYKPLNSHLLFRFADENRHFDEMTRWTELPKDGFGTIEGVKNFQFTNIHYAVQKDELSTELYIWTAEYGLAKYTITADKTTGLQDVKAINADNTKVQKVIVDGQLYIIRNGVSYTAMGQVVE